MARSATQHVCSSCGHVEAKWHGRCPGCGEWGTLVEEVRPAKVAAGGVGVRGGGRRGKGVTPVRLGDVAAAPVARLATGIGELDRVLGGGLVPGSLVLLGGSPGIGKSTIVTSALGNLAAAGRSVLYVSGEESAEQVRLRAERLGPGALAVPIVAETDLDAVVATVEAERPAVCVVDSVQVLHAAELTGAPGSVGQVREVAGRLMRVAKASGTAVVLVGHVTKEGALAGPRALEHLVDCVLSFEGERERTYRTLRALKNRFGSTNEAGVFEMREEGLVEVEDASARFVAEASRRAPGSAILCAMEGSRPLLVEVQALVAPTDVVPPRRMANGIDRNRLALVLAVLARHGGVALGSADVFVSLAGGVRVDEPAADLAIAIAIASAARGIPLGGDRPLAAFGELGLTGELRHVTHPDRRLAEAAKFGLDRTLHPGPDLPDLATALRRALTRPEVPQAV
ncbi:MAG: DNA repair protein RadA [Solirubrobacterales bacterium]|nr:DNA repair protein RadA [Solirubrobacterales bacterium]